MNTFLQRTARAIIDRHGDDLQQVAIVVPGQRAAAHLQKYLAEVIGRPFWAPVMLDMGRFLSAVAGARQATQAELLLTLHRLHGTLDTSGTNDLTEFLQWAPTTLRDMSEVDHHLIDLDELYRDLRSFAEIDQWSLALGEELIVPLASPAFVATHGLETADDIARVPLIHSLRCVVMEQVPWPRPDILHKARRLAGGGSAYDDRIIRARLAQAFGRLIRSKEDAGHFVMLSPAFPSRLLTAFPPGTPVLRVTLDEALQRVSAGVVGKHSVPAPVDDKGALLP